MTFVAATLRGRSHGAGVNMPGRGGEEAYGDNLVAMAVRTAQTGANGWGIGTDEQAYTLDGAQGQAVIAAGVRRLTPLECERLQGFPDDWTRWTADGREISDSHRYRMMGNAVTVSVAEWLGHRLMEVDA
jgi:DNA (cytosine-5)-methyltransferase 1